MIKLCKLAMMAGMHEKKICVFLKNQLMSLDIIIIGGLIKVPFLYFKIFV
jgi:hypothetical protein